MNRKQIMNSPRRHHRKNFFRVTGALVVTGCLALGASAASAGVLSKEKKIKLGNACTFVSARDVGRQFGKPVTVVLGAGLLGKYGCIVTTGLDPTVAPGGTLSVSQIFPYPFSNRSSAGAALEDERAYSASAGDDIKDVDDLGQGAYFDRTTGILVVQATNKLVFSLHWARAGATKATAADQKRLIKVALGIVTRSP